MLSLFLRSASLRQTQGGYAQQRKRGGGGFRNGNRFTVDKVVHRGHVIAWAEADQAQVHRPDGDMHAGDGGIVKSDAGQGINRKLPHLGDAGQGINRKLPHLGNAGRGEHPRTAFIRDWMRALQERMRDVRVTCGDWRRVVKDSVTTRHGVTGLFLDPPYENGAMDYGNGGMGLGIADDVRAWCAENGGNRKLRIVLCGHAGEHDALLGRGWRIRRWVARKGYALTDEAVKNSASETLWCSPHCEREAPEIADLFAERANV